MSAVQLGLFGAEALDFDRDYSAIRRIELGDGAWIEHQPGFVKGHEALFELLVRSTRFRIGEEQIYDRTVPTPRMVAGIPEDGPGHPVLDEIRESVSQRYGQRFVRLSLALYRDGRDSVAFHGDRIARTLPDALVATVSLGAPRRFLMRPRGGGTSQGWNLGWGDLFVMGGSAQRTWQHGVPKVARAQPRLSVMFRPHWEYAGVESARDPDPSRDPAL